MPEIRAPRSCFGDQKPLVVGLIMIPIASPQIRENRDLAMGSKAFDTTMMPSIARKHRHRASAAIDWR